MTGQMHRRAWDTSLSSGFVTSRQWSHSLSLSKLDEEQTLSKSSHLDSGHPLKFFFLIVRPKHK